MRRTALYLLWITAAVGAIYGIIRYGSRLTAPAALPKAWHYTAVQPEACPRFAHGGGIMDLHQSGETISVVFRNVPDFELHGKVTSDGAFHLSGELARRQLSGCGRGKLHMEGNISPARMQG